MFAHKPRQCGAVRAPIMAPQIVSPLSIYAKRVHHIGGHAHFDLIEKRHVRGIERVIEVEHPSVHVREMCFDHGCDASGNSQASQQVDQKCCCA